VVYVVLLLVVHNTYLAPCVVLLSEEKSEHRTVNITTGN